MVACHPAPPPAGADAQSRSAGKAGDALVGEVHSNILRADYAGSAACARCHPQIFADWQRSPMHRMTRRVAETDIRAPFSGSFHFKNDRIEFLKEHGERF